MRDSSVIIIYLLLLGLIFRMREDSQDDISKTSDCTKVEVEQKACEGRISSA